MTLVTIATAIDAILAGAVLDYSIKQLPARKTIEIVAYRKYFAASDFGNGRFWYIPLGLSSYALNVIVAALAYSESGLSSSTWLFVVAAGCAVIHSFGTSQAIPAGLHFLRTQSGDEAVLNKLFDRFAMWVDLPGGVGVPVFVAMLLGLILLS